MELSVADVLYSELVFICFPFYVLDFLLKFPFSYTDKLLCLAEDVDVLAEHEEVVAVERHEDEDMVMVVVRLRLQLQLHDVVGEGHQDAVFKIFAASMVVV